MSKEDNQTVTQKTHISKTYVVRDSGDVVYIDGPTPDGGSMECGDIFDTDAEPVGNKLLKVGDYKYAACFYCGDRMDDTTIWRGSNDRVALADWIIKAHWILYWELVEEENVQE